MPNTVTVTAHAQYRGIRSQSVLDPKVVQMRSWQLRGLELDRRDGAPVRVLRAQALRDLASQVNGLAAPGLVVGAERIFGGRHASFEWHLQKLFFNNMQTGVTRN